MLSNRDLYAEIEAIEKRVENLAGKEVLTDKEKLQLELDKIKIGTLTLKLMHNIRANMVTIMKHFNVELLKPQSKKEDVKETTKED